MTIGDKLPISSTVDNLRAKFYEAADSLLVEYEKEMDMLTTEAGKFLRELDNEKHDEDTVKSVIEAIPDSLRDMGHDHATPVQDIITSQIGYKFLPLLVREGVRLKLFTEEERGGFNVGETTRMRFVIMILVFGNNGREDLTTFDVEITKVLRELIEMNTIRREDIIKYDAICHASFSTSEKRLECLLDFFPEALFARNDGNNLPIQNLVADNNSLITFRKENFETLLKISIKYYPEKLGFLFRRGGPEDNRRTIDMAMSSKVLDTFDPERGEIVKIDIDEIFQWIHEVIPPSKEHPILHYAIRIAPKYVSLFWKHYPHAVYLRDKKGRLPLHIALQRAGKWSQPLLSLIGINDPIDRHEKDPVTGLCSFMSAASGKSSDVNVIYYLLRRDPNAWEGFRVDK